MFLLSTSLRAFCRSCTAFEDRVLFPIPSPLAPAFCCGFSCGGFEPEKHTQTHVIPC